MMYYLAFAVLFGIPLWKLVPNYRLPQWSVLLVVVPFGVFVLLWVMAFRDKIKIPGVDK